MQAGLAPFLAALVIAVPLHKTRLIGLGVPVAFAVVVGLTMGFSFESLTSLRKLVLIALLMTAAALALDLAKVPYSKPARFAASAIVGALSVWMVQRILAQQEDASHAWRAGAATALFVAILLASSIRIGPRTIPAASSSLMLGLGSGALALLGASAQLAQIGIAVGAGAGAMLLVQMMAGRRAPGGWTVTTPAAAVSSLGCVLAVFTGALPWFCVVPLLAVPWAATSVDTERRPVWQGALVASLLALLPVLIAVAAAWFAPSAGS